MPKTPVALAPGRGGDRLHERPELAGRRRIDLPGGWQRGGRSGRRECSRSLGGGQRAVRLALLAPLRAFGACVCFSSGVSALPVGGRCGPVRPARCSAVAFSLLRFDRRRSFSLSIADRSALGATASRARAVATASSLGGVQTVDPTVSPSRLPGLLATISALSLSCRGSGRRGHTPRR